MIYTTIKYTDLKPAGICLGVADLGVKGTEQQGYELMDAYLDQGGNFIDTARVYSNWVPGEKNRSERILGEWMVSRENRNNIILSTKGGHPELYTMHIPRLTKEEVTDDLNGSLKTLQTDYIDLYWLHRDDVNRPVEEIIEMLNGFVKEGKIRYYGCSNWTVNRIKEAVKYAREKGYEGFVANQMLWNIGCYNMKKIQDPTMVTFDKEMYKLHEEIEITAIPYSSQANGFFTKMSSQDAGEIEKAKSKRYYTDKNVIVYHKLTELCKQTGMSMTEITLNYIISQKINTIPIVGCKNIEQLYDSIKAVDKNLPDEVRMEIEDITNSGITR